ncbi:MAG: NAD(P)H-binding protein [Anaerolineales bacterium]
MAAKQILVTGASGYIAGKLIPRLLAAGYAVRCMVRTRDKIAYRSWAEQVEIVEADVSQPETLPAALAGINTAYYLIHNMSSGHGYQEIELAGAEAFALAAELTGVEHIIYLGGLADPADEIAPHMRSRIETGITLRQHPVPVTEFRAGVIAGPGSISFEMIRYICEQFPVLVGPSWLKNHSQPISAENVIDYLVAALENPNGRGQVFEVGGPERYTYAKVMRIFAQLRGFRRPILMIPFLPTALMAAVVGQLSPVPSEIAYQSAASVSGNPAEPLPTSGPRFTG